MKIAHIRKDREGNVCQQSILAHNVGVSTLASDFARCFGAEELARYIGILHDIGKYSEAFQRRINGSAEKVDHSTAGAQEALKLGSDAGVIAAFCIGGHHGGLPDMGTKFSDASDGTLIGKLRKNPESYEDFREELMSEIPSVPNGLHYNPCELYFITKMLFSSLVDADYLDTEAFMSGGTISRAIGEPMSVLSEKLGKFTAQWKNPTSHLNKRRSQILEYAVSHGSDGKGLFTLTVPTGGGKTVASMAFAISHALRHGLSRIIYVIPYTSIIEQTQRVYESIFGEENIIAHYAGVEYPYSDESVRDRRYLAAENWDAPIILTTSVQFFESLYGNRPSKCRKIHNIANSIIIFDEAQMLPVPYMRPCVLAITELVKNYGCSAVLCTATQPALSPLVSELAPEIRMEELCPDDVFSDPIFTRVKYNRLGKLTDEKIIEMLSKEHQCLCVVNSRKFAQSLFNRLPNEGRFHLSTAMMPEHRRRTLDEIRKRLCAGKECRVISTSLIEAGVDVDFATVFRELAGLDSIIQAGGRCNREGKRSADESCVYVFKSDHRVPDAIGQNCTAAERAMARDAEIASKGAIDAYFEFLLYVLKDKKALDQKDIIEKMKKLSFNTIAKEFNLISGAECTLYVDCEESKQLLEKLKSVGPSRELIRKLGQYSVNIYTKLFEQLLDCGAVEQLTENAGILRDCSLYDPALGLLIQEADRVDNYII